MLFTDDCKTYGVTSTAVFKYGNSIKYQQ